MENRKRYRVYRYWTVEYRSVAYVEASSPDEARRAGLEVSDYDDAEQCDGSESPVSVGQVVELNDNGEEAALPIFFFPE